MAKNSAELQVESVAIGRLFLSPINPRKNDAAVDPVAASITRFGFRQPIVARRSGEVIAGNSRLRAAQKLGLGSVPVCWFDGTDLEATGYAIADNRTHEFAEWDQTALVKLLDQLKQEDFLDATAFSETDLDELIAELKANEPRPTIDDAGPEPPPVNAVTRRGDLWCLGDHRLLCGDSTNNTEVARLLEGVTPVLLATDPPFAVRYSGKNRPLHNGKPSGKDWSKLYLEVEIEDWDKFLDGVFTSYLPRISEAAPIYLWHSHIQAPTIALTFVKHGLLYHQNVIWVKPSPVFTRAFFQYQHETCAFGWRKGFQPKDNVAQYTTIWQCDWEGKARIVGNEHPAQKPLRLFTLPMEIHTKPGDVVVEPFSGSGSQLIAAESIGRRCYGMELQPAFVDVAIRRWEKATQQVARLDGRSFADLRSERLADG